MAKSNSYKALLTQKQYLKLTLADIINRFGDSIDAIAFSIMMYDITGSAAMMSLIFGLNFLPTILLQPIFAVYVERMNKKRIMVLTDIGRGLVIGLIVLLFMTGRLNTVWLTVATLLNSTLEAFRIPAGIAMTPMLLSEEHYTTGSALRSTASHIAEIIGLAAAGAVVGIIGVGGALLVDAATFLISAAIIACIRISEEKKEAISNPSQLKDGLLDGVKYIAKSPMLIALFLLGMLLNFCMVPLNSLGTAYAVEALGAGAEFLSYMQLALVLGVAAGSAVTPKLNRFINVTLICGSGFLCSAAMLALYPLVWLSGWTRLSLVLAALLLLGLGVGVQSVIYSAAFMEHVDRGFLSRIGGLTNSFLCAAMPLGAFLCSLLTAWMPVPLVLLVFGLLMAAVYAGMSRIRIYREL